MKAMNKLGFAAGEQVGFPRAPQPTKPVWIAGGGGGAAGGQGPLRLVPGNLLKISFTQGRGWKSTPPPLTKPVWMAGSGVGFIVRPCSECCLVDHGIELQPVPYPGFSKVSSIALGHAPMQLRPRVVASSVSLALKLGIGLVSVFIYVRIYIWPIFVR